MSNAAPILYSDIQGIIRFGYARLTEASYVLLTVRDAAAARTWLKTAPVSTAEERPQPPDTALQVAFTNEGLQAINVPAHVRVGFSAEFLTGMAGDDARSRRLGDVGANSPQHWDWGARGNVPHVLVMLYAQPGMLKGWFESIQDANWKNGFEVLAILPTSDMHGFEPFGFKDGVSQPVIDWQFQINTSGGQLTYRNLISLGEFVLGYPNEYGKYTDRPLLPPSEAYNSVLREAFDSSTMRDLGLNGSYLVLRQLEQDVRGFWKFIEHHTNHDAEALKGIAAAMVGRESSGIPLIAMTSSPIEGVDANEAVLNQFNYDEDTTGTQCPFGAHVRRANPRNADLPPDSAGIVSRLLHTLGFGTKGFREDVIASTRFHRLLRRGREYGPALSIEEATESAPQGSEPCGIQFLAINANISRQFEFVQSSWIMGTKFNGLSGESDPLLGNREPIPGASSTSAFTMPDQKGLASRIEDLPQFITVKGGAYFFLPSISALRYFASIGT